MKQRITEALEAAKQFSGTEGFGHVITLLKAIEDGYKEDLIDVSEEQLKFKQGAAKQVRLLRAELCRQGPARDLPKI